MAANVVGTVTSSQVAAYAADLPSAPAAAPTLVIAQTTAETLRVEFAVLPAGSTGGSPILSYHLQRTPALSETATAEILDTFFDVNGGSSNYSLATAYTITGLLKGKRYGFRYRAINVNGPGAWSPSSLLTPAERPAAPSAAPRLVSASATQIQLALTASPDDGGAPVTQYQLEIDQGVLTSSLLSAPASVFSPIAAYDFAVHGLSYTVDAAALSLTAGKLYRFRLRAVNVMGASHWSDTSRIGLDAPPPAVPTGPARHPDPVGVVDLWNTNTSIGVGWGAITGTSLPVVEYILYVDDGLGGEVREAYRGALTKAKVSNLTAGLRYTFFVKAANYNGLGAASGSVKLRSCVAPLSVQPPTLHSATTTAVTLRWT